MLGLFKVGFFTILWLPLVAGGLYALGLTIYRLFLSPLAKFPGSKLAALTRKYESYYEAVENYEYLWKIKKMHEQYGKLVEELCKHLFRICLFTPEIKMIYLTMLFRQDPSSASVRTRST